MPTIAYNTLAAHVDRTPAVEWPTVTLVFGEETLCERACASVVALLVSPSDRTLGVERFDGAEDNMDRMLSSLRTYGLFCGTKVVVLYGCRLFHSAGVQQGLQEKVAQAARSGDMQKASRSLVNLMVLCGLTTADLTAPALKNQFVGHAEEEPGNWFSQLIDHCRENRIHIPDKRDDAQQLVAALEKGFPEGHRLIITTDWVDRRKALFKLIDAKGLVVDCGVPKGEARSDRLAQDAVMNAALNATLEQAAKQLTQDARRQLLESTGFDLRTLAGNLDRLISYVGDRPTITGSDVTAVVRRTRKDPIFAFTNAVAERELSTALFYMHRLLEAGAHPLQLLAALANQIRRLLVAKAFILRDGGSSWSPGMTYARFQSSVFKAIQAEDQRSARFVETWGASLHPPVEGKKCKKPADSDLVLAKHPKSAFAVFQTLNTADSVSLQTLTSAMGHLSRSDIRMKSTAQDHHLILEALVMRLCQRPVSAPGVNPRCQPINVPANGVENNRSPC